MKPQTYVVEPPAGFEPQIGRWLWALEDGRCRTREALGDLPGESLDWIPAHGGNSIGTLLYHLAAIEMDWLYTEVLEGAKYPPEMARTFPHDVRDEAGVLVPVMGETVQQHWGRLDWVRGQFLDAFMGMSLEEFRRPRRLEKYEVTPEWVIHHLIQHEAEHRGQMGEIRLMAGQAK
jgi:uncharacterized damage-inducible protein DinB